MFCAQYTEPFPRCKGLISKIIRLALWRIYVWKRRIGCGTCSSIRQQLTVPQLLGVTGEVILKASAASQLFITSTAVFGDQQGASGWSRTITTFDLFRLFSCQFLSWLRYLFHYAATLRISFRHLLSHKWSLPSPLLLTQRKLISRVVSLFLFPWVLVWLRASADPRNITKHHQTFSCS